MLKVNAEYVSVLKYKYIVRGGKVVIFGKRALLRGGMRRRLID